MSHAVKHQPGSRSECDGQQNAGICNEMIRPTAQYPRPAQIKLLLDRDRPELTCNAVRISPPHAAPITDEQRESQQVFARHAIGRENDTNELHDEE